MLKYLILGAGPAGLTFANRLKQNGEDNFLLLEKENEAGGLCRSKNVCGSPIDIGGGHFLDVRRPKVNDFLFGFMPEEEWNAYDRDSQIMINTQYIHHPFEANIGELDTDLQVEYLKSIAQAGCNFNAECPTKFTDWIRWKLGDRIADDYMLPYNRKMFGDDLNLLGTYWLEKLPDVSFEDTLRSCLEHKAFAKQPGHARFYYPKKYGYGELWRRMANNLGENLQVNSAVYEMNFDLHLVKTKDGKEYFAEKIITTIPWKEFKHLVGMPSDIKAKILELKNTSVQVEYFNESIDTTAHWIYYPDEELPYHRILVRHNFCEDSKGYWTETNKDRIVSENYEQYIWVNEYAYPLNTIEKPKIMKKLLDWCKTKEVYGLGRWGEHNHYNSDLAVELAMKLADKMLAESCDNMSSVK